MEQKNTEKLSTDLDYAQSIEGATFRLRRQNAYRVRKGSVSTLILSDACYLAGLFDGEGCLTVALQMTIRKKHLGGILNPHIVLIVTNTCLNVIEWCLETIGTGRIVQSRAYSEDHPRRMPAYKYILDTNLYLVQLLPQLLEHLKVKRRQAELALGYLESREGKYRGNYSRSEVDTLFNLRHSNLKDYDLLGSPTIRYRGNNYDTNGFANLFFERRYESGNQYIEWTTEMDALVGTDIDIRIAKRLGVNLSAVQGRRTTLGIRPFSKMRSLSAEVLRLKSTNRTQREIATLVGLSRTSVNKIVNGSV
jgi:hypothetical protein